jgi:hypothetical protein
MDYFPYMSSDPEENSSLQKALAGGALQHIGWYSFYFADERWEWSAEAADRRISTWNRHPDH